MKKSSFNTNVEKMRRITNSLEQEGDTEQLRYIRDGLYHVGGSKMTPIKNSLSKFAKSVQEAFECRKKIREKFEKDIKDLKEKNDKCEALKEKDIKDLKEKFKKEIEDLDHKYTNLKFDYDTFLDIADNYTSRRLEEEKDKDKLNNIINEPNQTKKIERIIENEKPQIIEDLKNPSSNHALFDFEILPQILIDLFTGHQSHIIEHQFPMKKYISILNSRNISVNQDPYFKSIYLIYKKYYHN